ncbi:MAG: cation:proton antiporter, partial [Bacillota bacterium]
MGISLALIVLLGLVFNKAFNKIKLPGLLGMLILGVIIGPYGLDIIGKEILNISDDLRKIALIVILLRAGLGIEKETLKKIGIPAVRLSFIPGLMEGFTIILVSQFIFKLSFIEAGIMAFIIAAVSPAVVVPQMLNLIKNKKGSKKGIPTLILTGASIDDVIAITLFSTFLSLYGGSQLNIFKQIINIPISIIIGIIAGALIAFLLVYFFKKYHMRDTKKVLLMLSLSILLTGLEDLLKGIIPLASLLGVMAIGFLLQEKYHAVGARLATKFNKIWVFAEIMLFVLVGAEVNIHLALNS